MADGRRHDTGREHERGRRGGTSGDRSPVTVSRKAMDQLSMLTSRAVEGVSRLEHDEDGWLFQVEIVELDRIPDSTSVLASYETRTDEDGNVLSYHRTRRYPRNQAGEL
ncbi:gas vesicle protein GvpO [Actinopolymorpha sp. B17G11]|uniref:gas vesicle protein GvpO n=1 Tax=unclassified Actinopolymorpha TaxID=2627063 RepID=UPI0032D92790